MHLSLVVFVALIGAASAVNYTCQALAFIKDPTVAACIGPCATTAAGSFKGIKACKKTCKLTKAQKALKKPTATYLKCLSTYFKFVAVVAKKQAAVTASVNTCVATTSDFSQCKIQTFVPSSDAKTLKKATKADAKWNGKKCVSVLTPSATVCPNGASASSTTTTVRAATGATASAATTVAPTTVASG